MLNAISSLLISEHRFDDAEALYRDALILAPDNPSALCGFSKVLTRKGDLKGERRVQVSNNACRLVLSGFERAGFE